MSVNNSPDSFGSHFARVQQTTLSAERQACSAESGSERLKKDKRFAPKKTEH
jgi:hypothetical protein